MASNKYITSAAVAAMGLEVLVNSLKFAKAIPSDYNDEFGDIGSTVNVKVPPRWLVGEGAVIEPQAYSPAYVPITIEKQFHVPASIASADLTLSEGKFFDLLKKSALPELANQIDSYLVTKLTPYVSNFIAPGGGLGTIDAGTATAAQALQLVGGAAQYMTEVSVPSSGRVGVLAPKAKTGLITAYSSLFNPQDDGASRFKTGKVGTVQGIEFAEDVNILSFTNGTLNTTAAAGASAQGSSNTVQDARLTSYSMTIVAPSATIKKGQVVTISGLYEVNPLARTSLGRLKTFVVQEDIGASDTTMKILPYPVFSGAYQNVYSATGGIAAGATITSVSGVNSSSYTQNLLFHPNAFQMASVRLKEPPNGESGFAYDKETGLGIRYWRDGDIRTDQIIQRFDVLIGAAAVDPSMAIRVSG